MALGGIKAGEAYVQIYADKSRLNRQLRTLKSDFTTAGRGLNQALAFAGVAGGLGALVTQSVKLAAANEQLALSYRVLAGDAKVAGDLVARLREFAAVTPFQTDEILAAGKQLLAFGFSADEIEGQLNTLGNIAAATGTSFQDMAFLVGTSRSQFQIYTQDLNQFTGRGIPVLELLAEKFGVATSEVKGLAAEGKITFKELNEVLTELGQNKWGDLMSEQADTAAGKWSTLTSNVKALQTEFGNLVLAADEAGSSLLGGAGKSLIEDFTVGLGVITDPIGNVVDPVLEAEARQQKEFQDLQRRLAERRREEAAGGPMGRFTGRGGIAAAAGEAIKRGADFGTGAGKAFLSGLSGIKDQFTDLAPIIGDQIQNTLQVQEDRRQKERDAQSESEQLVEQAMMASQAVADQLGISQTSFRSDARASGVQAIEQEQLSWLVQIAQNTQPLAGGV